MHLGLETAKSKSEAMFFPASLKQARLDQMNNHVPKELILPNSKKVHFINKFKYLGSIITLLLNKDAESQNKKIEVYHGSFETLL